MPRTEDVFPLSGPMPPSQLVGRERWKQRVATGVANGTSTAVPGGRKDGKTSACEAVIDSVASNFDVLAIPLDLYEAEGEEGFLLELVSATFSALAATGRKPRGSGGRLLGRLASLGLKEAGLDPDLASLLEDDWGGIDATLTLPSRAGQLKRKKVVVFIDEAQRMIGYSDSFKRKLHKAFRDSSGISLLLSGSGDDVMDGLLNEPLGPLAGLIPHVCALDPIEDHEWRKGLKSLFALLECTIDADAIEYVIDGGKQVGVSPVHSTITIAHHTHLHAYFEGQKHISVPVAAYGYTVAEPNLRRLEGRA